MPYKSHCINGHRRTSDNLYRRSCKTCGKLGADKIRRERKANGLPPKYSADSIRNSAYKRKYDITLLDYNRILVLQNHKCAICKRDQTECKKRFAVDHNHTTRQVRGLLCDACNNGLGRFQDSSDVCMLAAQYLNRFKGE